MTLGQMPSTRRLGTVLGALALHYFAVVPALLRFLGGVKDIAAHYRDEVRRKECDPDYEIQSWN